MNVKLELTNNRAFSWYHHNGNFYWKGFIYNENNQLIRENELFKYLEDCINDKNLFINQVKLMNGHFILINKIDDEIIIVADKIRSFSLFYKTDRNKIQITDVLKNFESKSGLIIDDNSVEELLQTGFITGNDTIYENVYQIRASEITIISEYNIERTDYYTFMDSADVDKGFEYYSKRYREIIDNVAKRLINEANGRQIVLSLSAGHDSRLIANMLYFAGYKNVLCFTYGTKDSFEVPIARLVAEKLGFRWIFVEYSYEFLDGFERKNDFIQFADYHGNSSAIPHIQDYFAIEYLVKNNLIEKDAIFVNGHRPVFYLYEYMFFNRDFDKIQSEKTVNLILKHHYIFEKKYDKKLFKRKIRKQLNGKRYYEEFIDWQTKEFYSKFIFNSVRSNDYWGYEYRMPLLDDEIVEFFKKLPLKYKLLDNLYDKLNNTLYFEKTDTNQIPTAYKTANKFSFIKQLLKVKLLRFVHYKISYNFLTRYHNINNFEFIISKLVPEYKKIGKTEIWFNGNIAKWYVNNFINKNSRHI